MGAQIHLLLLVFALPATVDYVMGPAEVNTALKAMSRARDALEGPANREKSRDRAETLFALAAEAENLAELINLEIASHGFVQKPLIDLTLERCARLGVQIFFDEHAERYLYDRAAFVKYLELAPDGADSNLARYLLIERAFEKQGFSDMAALRELIRQASALREVDQEMACELDYFTGVGYLRLSELEDGSTEKKSTQSKAIEILTGITRNCRMTPEATLARRELQRLQAVEGPQTRLQTNPKESPR